MIHPEHSNDRSHDISHRKHYKDLSQAAMILRLILHQDIDMHDSIHQPQAEAR